MDEIEARAESRARAPRICGRADHGIELDSGEFIPASDLPAPRVIDDAFEAGERIGFEKAAGFNVGWGLLLVLIGYAIGWWLGGRR